MKNAICYLCGETYPARRKEIGYNTCLECGGQEAEMERVAKSKRITVAYNKGPVMYITSPEAVKGIFKCGETK